MSGIVGSKLNIRGSGRVAKLGTDGQVLTSAGAGVSAVYENAAGGGTSWQSVETGSTMTAVAGNGYPVNTTAQACTVTLPAGSVGDTIEFVDYAGTWDTNAVTLTADGSEKIKGSTDDVLLLTERQGVKIVYVDATQGWVAATGVNDRITAPALKSPDYDVEWLVVGGGGSGGKGNGGAGGAGGYRTGASLTLTGGNAYTVTVGAGGAITTSSGVGNDGSDSTLSGTGITTVTSTGGGGGGGAGAAPAPNGRDGGSGGGTDYNVATPGSGNTPSITPISGETTTIQGYDGGVGAGAGGTPEYGAGGGGGAGAVGGTGTSEVGGVGGVGVANDIIETGTDVYYAGGGGGSVNATNGDAGAGGNGGGGAGTRDGTAGSGDANTGGGGGGGHISDSGAGGSGIIVLRMLTARYSGTTTGSPTESIDGDYKVLKFTGSGSYTA